MGFQDETLMMYCDERDMSIRLDNLGYKELVLKDAVAWHQHVNRPGTTGRSLFAPFYSSRNRIYLVHKHSTPFRAYIAAFKTISFASLLILYHLLNNRTIDSDRAVICGTYYGLRGKMNVYPNWLRVKSS